MPYGLETENKQKQHDSRYKREETNYDNLPETILIVVKDGFVTFCRHFKYLGSRISFSLREDHDIMKRIAAANASMGAMSKIWDNDHVDTYSKYLIFKAISCNLLLWRCESWDLINSLLASLEVFLHRGIRRILKIRMSKVIEQHIINTSIQENFTTSQQLRNKSPSYI